MLNHSPLQITALCGLCVFLLASCASEEAGYAEEMGKSATTMGKNVGKESLKRSVNQVGNAVLKKMKL